MKTNTKRCWLALVCALSLYGCDSDSSDSGISLYAEPTRIHAPGSVTFSMIRDDGKDLIACEGQWDFKDGVKLQGATEVSHEYKTAGKYNVWAGLTCGSMESYDTVTVEVYESVDLTVSAIEARPLDVSSDGKLNLSFQISNEAETALQVPTYIDIYLTQSGEPTGYLEGGATRIYRYTLSKLPGIGSDGSVEKIELEIPMSAEIRTGAYYVAVVANPDHNVGEVSDANNIAVSTQSITVRNQLTDGADFTPISFKVSPAKTSVLSSATAQLRILNQGSTTAESFQYEIWIGQKNNGTDMNGAVKIHEGSIQGGMSGVEQQINDIMFSVTPTVSDPGLYYFWIKLDTTDVIVERDEDNNFMRSENPIQIDDEPVLDADIIVDSVSFTPSSASPGGAFTTYMKLYNQGSQQTGSFICTIFLSSDMSLDVDKDRIVGAANIDNLLPQSTQEIHATAETDTGISQGKYWVFVFCDSSGVVNEANEDNNIQRSDSQITVTGNANVDLVFGPITSNELTASHDGDPLNLSAIVCNNGSTAAGPFQISVVRKNLCDSTDTEISRIDIDGINGKACENLFINDPIQCDFWCPSYQISLTADVNRVILEKDENNNTTSLAEILSLNGDQCVCASDAHEYDNTVDSLTPTKQLSENLNLCVKDVDLFLLDLHDGDSFEAYLNHDSSVSQLTMELLRGPEVTDSRVTGNELFLSGAQLSDVTANPAYIRIKGIDGKAANQYHLDLSTYGKVTGTDLMLSALTLPDNRLTISETSDVSLMLNNLGSENINTFYIDYYLSRTPWQDDTSWRLTRQQVSGLKAGASREQHVSLVLPADIEGGTWYLIASAELPDLRPENNIARSVPWFFERKCWDSLDPNDSFENPRKLSFSGTFSHAELTVCQKNPDFYELDLKDGSALDISVTGTTPGDFDLYLYDVHGNVIDSARTTATTEKIHRDIIVGDQTVILEVRLLDNIYNASETNYEMTIKVSDAPAYLSCNAAFEPNDFMSAAYPLRDAAFSAQKAAICPSYDEDFYQIPLAEGERLQIGFDTKSTILRAALYNSQNTFLGMLTNLTTQTFDYTATAEDIYYLRIFTNASGTKSQEYAIKWLGAAGTDIAVTSMSVSEPAPYAGQPVVVSFILDNKGTSPVDTQYRIALETSAGQTQLASGTRSLAAGSHESIMEKVTIPAKFTGPARMVVSAQTDNDDHTENNAQSKSITILPACINDSQEPNNNILQATDLKSDTNGVICPGDEDWFKVVLASAQTIRLSFAHKSGDLKLTAYKEDGAFLSESDTASDSESISLDAGTYYLRVMGVSSDITNSYNIQITDQDDSI